LYRVDLRFWQDQCSGVSQTPSHFIDRLVVTFSHSTTQTMVCKQPAVISEQELEEDGSIHSADIVFEVEKCFFDVPRRWFEDSPVFCKMFELPIVQNTMPDGSIRRPFRLDGIDKTDFKQLLRVMASSH